MKAIVVFLSFFKEQPRPKRRIQPIWPLEAAALRQQKLHEPLGTQKVHAAFDIPASSTLKDGGDGRDRTGDPLLAKQVLSQLSYIPPPSSAGRPTPKNGGPNWSRTSHLTLIRGAL